MIGMVLLESIMLINIPGHSDFNVSVLEENNKTIILKKSTNKQNSLRLEKQAKKQEDFLTNNILAKFKSPLILSKGFENGHFYFKMEYINNIDIVHYFEITGKEGLLYLEISLTNLIKDFINQSPSKLINKEIIFNKYTSIKQIIQKNNITFDFKNIDAIIHNIEDLVLPVGICHGDLTFSNILIDRSNMITLIDFLDSFIETPLCDMVKIRQDTQYKWSQLLYNKQYDKTKIKTRYTQK